MTKKKVFIISHSHWDREWYLAYEQHHMRLVELMDDLLELFETDPDFNSFHLDGQTIILDDYLQVRPEKREAVQQAITAGKLQIGPFYILQDDFLTSSESNTRNMLIGHKESLKWGTPVALGYFPDTFGNMGQTPQMMLQANLPAAAYGRGVKPIGFDNEVLADDNFTSQYSEMYWEGPDKSRIFGLLFANWYSNGNEIPAEEEAAKVFWKQKLADAEKFASTGNLLMMNGVDHQPVQKDLSKAIALANQLFPEYEFVHSNFTEYLEAVEKDLPTDLGTMKGELTSQETDGWYTLANTASARVYLKQWNTRVSRQLENIAEPLAAMAYEVTGTYPHDQLDYAWKTLMQNHPHDSICGCSVDEVHREMMPRFEKANEVGKYVADEALAALTSAIDTSAFPADSKPFVVFNTSGATRSGLATLEVELERKTFAQGVPQNLYKELQERPAGTYHVVNAAGDVVAANISSEDVHFDYDLPKDRFRIPYMERSVMVEVEVADMAPFSWETFALVAGAAPTTEGGLVSPDGRVLENDWIKAEIQADGSLSLFNKALNKQLDHLLVFEDMGDIANEYIFKSPVGDQAILSTDFPYTVEVMENNRLKGVVKVTHQMMIPASADALLEEEQRAVMEFRARKAGRSENLIPFTIETLITIQRQRGDLQFATTVDNQAKDHRLRALFPTTLAVATHEADSIFEAVTRPNQPSSHWENPTNPQHQHAFVNLHDADFGVTVNNFGLNEYEIVEDTIALTLLRCVGELGDWGWFPTPEAQCLGQHTFNYGIVIYGAPATRYETYKQAQALQVPLLASQTKLHAGNLPTAQTYVTVAADNFAITALKRRWADNQLILRGYNLADEPEKFALKKDGAKALHLLNLLEEEQAETVAENLAPYEIRTIGIVQ